MDRRFAPLVALLLVLVASAAWGLIEVLTPLETLVKADVIALLKVEKLDLEKQTAVLVVERSWRGKLESNRLPLRLKGDDVGDPRDMLDRIEVGQQVVVFITPGETLDIGNAYSEGSWFQWLGHRDGKRARWTFTHGEPFLRRTFHGSTTELATVLDNHFQNKEPLPAADASQKQGFGPKIDRSQPRPAVAESTEKIDEPEAETAVAAPTSLRDDWLSLAPLAGTIIIGAAGLMFLLIRRAG